MKNTLLPPLPKDDIIVLDNMRSRHAKSVCSWGCQVAFALLCASICWIAIGSNKNNITYVF